MAFLSTTFLDPTAPVWHWPLRIGVAAGDEDVIGLLTKGTRSRNFYDIELVAEASRSGRKNFDLLIFPAAGPQHIAEDSRSNWQATCIIFLQGPNTFEDSTTLDNRFIHNYLAKVASLYGSKGVVIVDPGASLSGWFEAVVNKLSRNLNVVTALRNEKTINGYFFVDPILERISTISFAIERIVDQLKYRPGSLLVHSWMAGKRLYRSDEVLHLLSKIQSESMYIAERGASLRFVQSLREIYRQLEKPVGFVGDRASTEVYPAFEVRANDGNY